ncbi:hypothetical protein NBM05_07470 [Rothia sp. AR01]|uniref:Uncharacterized protein n=1 Tax=Rothia santali TaxID=2949643 RepID=A0A9X2HA71_9MICC|nr:hypothetical protein [Rothia santali]MCP3425849.1 hypothetical protein [Rothia santali]
MKDEHIWALGRIIEHLQMVSLEGQKVEVFVQGGMTFGDIAPATELRFPFTQMTKITISKPYIPKGSEISGMCAAEYERLYMMVAKKRTLEIGGPSREIPRPIGGAGSSE